MYPPITYITDCTDPNAQARLSARIAALFGHPPSIYSFGGASPEISAGLTLLDILRATELLGEERRPTITLVNVAPRDGKWPNGAPFCYFWHGNQLILSTFSKHTLALVREHAGVSKVHVTDVRTVLEAAAESWAAFGRGEIDGIATTQFRSLWYLPLLAKWVADGRQVPSVVKEVSPIQDNTVRVAVIDNFGNCKLNCRGEDIGFLAGALFELPDSRKTENEPRKVPCYHRLTDVPEDEPGLILGSSGYDFVELVVRRSSAADEFQLHEGDLLPLRRVSRRGSN